MPRVSNVPLDEIDDELLQAAGVDRERGIDPLAMPTLPVYAHAPDLAMLYLEFTRGIRAAASLAPRLLELVRLRVAFHNQCRSCMAIRDQAASSDGVTQTLVCSLAAPEDAPDITDAERSALRYADLLATNHLAIDDDTFADLRAHFTDREIVELMINAATFVGFGRVSASLAITDHLPEAVRDAETVGPWSNAYGFVAKAAGAL